ncbi:hypothetical protein NQ314_010955 [Rhamnusium bicolor]|uniref:Uncharacterized protein n=1 Tax=Rhamnusium bicolor TaxID=1586634 RepID=A0AAV8XNC4_9CUCU|nr:hypothetical protein NQ314_010955 [Rhamnusium bicolor]
MRELEQSKRFPSILKRAAAEIVELFPGERMESYFIPYTRKTNSTIKKLPRGKLYSRWVNCKRALTVAKTDTLAEGNYIQYDKYNRKQQMTA